MAIITPLLFAFNNRKHISASVTASLLLNILISTIFVIVRKTPGICEYMPYHEVNKVACVFPMVVVFILPHAEFGPNDHQENAAHCTSLD